MDDRTHLLNLRSEPYAELHQFGPFRRSHIDPFGELIAKDSVFGLEILDGLDQFFLGCPGQEHQQGMYKATSVNTWEGWREMRLGIFSKRHRGEATAPEDWDDRRLPSPHVRVAFAAIENSARFGSRWGQWVQRLGIRDTTQITVLADGAGWIWQQAAMHFPGAAGMLDIYHALEHVAETAKAVYGENTARCRRWIDSIRTALLSGGWPTVRQRLRAAWLRTKRESHRKTLQSLAGYLGKHRLRLDYAGRLAEGRSIGSGQVEGACKHVIGRRLKQTGARWRVRRANRMASLCCLLYSDHWDLYWASP